ncbi:MAG: DUF4835 family protein [Paludibacteraceae bacterium]|nr:DUF4835 family protein [Paludibacteraceae bacterium]MBR6041725.1 DUF4835 family protein [Paludibacteraceae bacterium]
MKNKLFIALLGLFLSAQTQAQELNARVEVNAQQLEGTNKDIFSTLQSDLGEYINSHKWTDAVFNNEERIECTFVITIESVSGNTMNGNLQISASRTVYNSSYTTPIFNFKDKNFSFNYAQYDRLEFNDNVYESNLMSVMAFYCYIILGVDFDTYSRYGGQKFFEKAETIAALARSSEDEGWQAYKSDNNRYALISNYMDNTLRGLREIFYDYHRLGLDMMSQNVENGKSQILSILPGLQTMNSAKPFSVALQNFTECKLNELVDMFRNSSASDKQKVYEILSAVLPTQTTKMKDLTSN